MVEYNVSINSVKVVDLVKDSCRGRFNNLHYSFITRNYG